MTMTKNEGLIAWNNPSAGYHGIFSAIGFLMRTSSVQHTDVSFYFIFHCLSHCSLSTGPLLLSIMVHCVLHMAAAPACWGFPLIPHAVCSCAHPRNQVSQMTPQRFSLSHPTSVLLVIHSLVFSHSFIKVSLAKLTSTYLLKSVTTRVFAILDVGM